MRCLPAWLEARPWHGLNLAMHSSPAPSVHLRCTLPCAAQLAPSPLPVYHIPFFEARRGVLMASPSQHNRARMLASNLLPISLLCLLLCLPRLFDHACLTSADWCTQLDPSYSASQLALSHHISSCHVCSCSLPILMARCKAGFRLSFAFPFWCKFTGKQARFWALAVWKITAVSADVSLVRVLLFSQQDAHSSGCAQRHRQAGKHASGPAAGHVCQRRIEVRVEHSIIGCKGAVQVKERRVRGTVGGSPWRGSWQPCRTA